MSVVSFRFNLSDDKDFEIIYVSHDAKDGQIISSHVFDYTTEADIDGLWDNLAYETFTTEESILPRYET